MERHMLSNALKKTEPGRQGHKHAVQNSDWRDKVHGRGSGTSGQSKTFL